MLLLSTGCQRAEDERPEAVGVALQEGVDDLSALYPDSDERDEICYLPTGLDDFPGPHAMLTVPIKVHTVVRGDGSAGLSLTALQPAIDDAEDLLRDAMLSFEVDPNVGIVQSDVLFDLEVDAAEDYHALFRDHNEEGALNLYFVNSISLVAQAASLRSLAPTPERGTPDELGVLVLYDADGREIAHGFGHRLGLYHTFEDWLGTRPDDGSVDCWAFGDQLCDTEPDRLDCEADVACASTSCGHTEATDVLNLLSARTGCRSRLSDQQISRMRCHLERGGLGIDVVEAIDCVDVDGDGYGEGVDCLGSDCNEADPFSHSGTHERCDSVDNDCDGDIDEGVTSTYYTDADGDGYGDPNGPSYERCSPGPGLVVDRTDCLDTDLFVNPGEIERCNGIDDNCDGVTDDGFDNDGDGFKECGQAPDCDDDNNLIFPGALDNCLDNIDQDCDGTPAACLVDCLDVDGDNYGVGLGPYGSGCLGPDCDDNNPYVAPGAVEACNGIDENCNDLDDFQENLGTTYYQDGDGDGYGNAAMPIVECAMPDGYSRNNIDCDDADSTVHPTATELCNLIDDNCDGQVDEGQDGDNDGYDPCGPDFDCDDANIDVFPGATEIDCDGLDNDCDGTADPGCGLQVAFREIALEPGTSGWVDVPILAGAPTYTAFLAIETLQEDTDFAGNCDFDTDIQEIGSTVRFTVTLVGGCDSDYISSGPPDLPAFVAQAVVVTHNGPDGWLGEDSMSLFATSANLLVPANISTQVFPFCSWISFDDDEDHNDTGRDCTPTADWAVGAISSTLSTDCGNAQVVWEAKLVALGLSPNLSGELVEFECDVNTSGGSGETIDVSHLLGPGPDHVAFVIPEHVNSNSCDNHVAWQTVCTNNGASYVCQIQCKGTQNWMRGKVLFLDGDFLY